MDQLPGLREEADHVLAVDHHPNNLPHDHLHQVLGGLGRTGAPFLSLSRAEFAGTFAFSNEGCQLQKAERAFRFNMERGRTIRSGTDCLVFFPLASAESEEEEENKG